MFMLWSSLLFAEEQTPELQIKNQSDPFALPSIEGRVPLISSDREEFLISKLPRTRAKLSPFIPNFPYEKLGYEELSHWTYKLDEGRRKYIKDAIAKINRNLMGPSPEDVMEKYYLLADLHFTLGLNGDQEAFLLAKSHYLDAFKRFPNAPYAVQASYHLGLIHLALEEYSQALIIGYRQLERWKEVPEWRKPFRDLIMESYVGRGRYVRAQDFFYETAHLMNRSELSKLMALRYGDSLFWDKKYDEAVRWYASVTQFLDLADSTAEYFSRFFYAEALFQIGRYQEAGEHFKRFQNEYKGDYPIGHLLYRLEQVNLLSSRENENSAAAFKRIQGRMVDFDLFTVAKVQWARLVAKSNQQSSYIVASKEIEKIINDKQVRPRLKKEALYVSALLDWRMNQSIQALSKLSRFLRKTLYIANNGSQLEVDASDLATLILTELHKVHSRKNDYMGFLILADRFKELIEISRFRIPFLVIVADSYTKVAIYKGAARLYQRILFQLDPDPIQKQFIALRLAIIYNQLGEGRLARKSLDLVEGIPDNQVLRGQYYLSLAGIAENNGQYKECLDNYEKFLKLGVRGDELFTYSLKAAQCARRSREYEKAFYFISLMGVNENNFKIDQVSEKIAQYQVNGIFEKLKIYNDLKEYEKSVMAFELIKDQFDDRSMSLDALFTVVYAYQRDHKPDQAMDLWKIQSARIKGIPDEFKKQYDELLHMMAETELISRN